MSNFMVCEEHHKKASWLAKLIGLMLARLYCILDGIYMQCLMSLLAIDMHLLCGAVLGLVYAPVPVHAAG